MYCSSCVYNSDSVDPCRKITQHIFVTLMAGKLDKKIRNINSVGIRYVRISPTRIISVRLKILPVVIFFNQFFHLQLGIGR